jgi:hypothetical protein
LTGTSTPNATESITNTKIFLNIETFIIFHKPAL